MTNPCVKLNETPVIIHRVYIMTNTIFETIIQVMLPSRSANAILYFIENKGWFSKYRVPGGYAIPYLKWIEHTMITTTKIEVLSAFVFDRKGKIYHDENVVYIRESELKPFVSKTPREHIEYICHKHHCTYVLAKYLEEFYYTEITDYHDNSRAKYYIPFGVWYELFKMTPKEIDELGKVITSGYLRVMNRDGVPFKVEICL